ncbi:MAG: magnesium/cobalt transporter CorA, partial [Bacillota bacterium]
PPGYLIHLGNNKDQETKIEHIKYNRTEFTIEKNKSEEINNLKLNNNQISWLNIQGVQNEEIIEKIGSKFEIHPLILEDITNTEQLPKMDYLKDHIFIVLPMLYFDQTDNKINSKQISLLIGDNYVISFQEDEGAFDVIKKRLKNKKGKVRTKGTDYLAYSLIDFIIDNYFLVLEIIEDKIETLEKNLIEEPTTNNLESIQHLKRETIYLRKLIWPLRKVINSLIKLDTDLVVDSTIIYLRDLYNHIIEVADMISLQQEILTNLLDLYLSSENNKMSEIMKMLTIISTIFIPLTFIAGLYGMNFQHMPELSVSWGYPAVLGVMLSIAVVLIVFFKDKDWL